jgi:hypothetical protein
VSPVDPTLFSRWHRRDELIAGVVEMLNSPVIFAGTNVILREVGVENGTNQRGIGMLNLLCEYTCDYLALMNGFFSKLRTPPSECTEEIKEEAENFINQAMKPWLTMGYPVPPNLHVLWQHANSRMTLYGSEDWVERLHQSRVAANHEYRSLRDRKSRFATESAQAHKKKAGKWDKIQREVDRVFALKPETKALSDENNHGVTCIIVRRNAFGFFEIRDEPFPTYTAGA